MNIFGLRITTKPAHVESEEIKSLHKLLKEEKKLRADADKKREQVKKEHAKVVKEQERQAQLAYECSKKQAIAHLRIAERYADQLTQCKGARHSEIKALLDSRLEKAEHLGFKVTGDITKAINKWL